MQDLPGFASARRRVVEQGPKDMQLADRQITVAVVDDDPLFLEYLVARMSGEREINLVTAKTGDELFDVLRQRPVDCLVLDYDLGEETGLALAARVKRDIPDPPPVIMATGNGSERTAIKAFRGGFSDYVAKQNLAVSELLSAVREAVVRHRRERTATSDVERAKRELKFDAITGLYGQRFIEDRLRELTDDDSGREFALIALQPRGFDQIVRSHGTVMGDAILRELGRKLRADTRDSDIRGRWDRAAF
ncbi:MAG: response regulator, partial [Cucumibacter sp.]